MRLVGGLARAGDKPASAPSGLHRFLANFLAQDCDWEWLARRCALWLALA